MVKFNISLCFIVIFLITIVTRSSSRDTGMLEDEKIHQLYSYCIAIEGQSDTKLQDIIDCYCKKPLMDCKEIRPGEICYQPNNLYAHASVALDLYHHTEKICPLFDGRIQYVDRPVGACPYYPGPP